MRFGKRLALAMIRDAGEAPYLSQKSLKHVLVGLEKLCKSFAEQTSMLQDQNISHEDLVIHANMEREKYGLPLASSLLNETEIISRDAELFQIIDDDVCQIRRYVEACEVELMVAINSIFDDMAHSGIIAEESIIIDSNLSISQDILAEYISRIESISEEHERINQYIKVNAAAIRKLVGRRNKNVASSFWSVVEYENIENLKSAEMDQLTDAVNFLESSIPSSE